MNWYALFVENGKEEVVQDYLNLYLGKTLLKSIVPKRKLPERKAGKINHVYKKMFPGYVFIYTNMNDQIFNIIKKIPQCYRLVNTGYYYSKESGTYFTTIDKKEIDFINKLSDAKGIIEYSKVCIVNSKVKVHSGPLTGLEGIIKKVDKRKKRAKLLINFMGRKIMVDVGIEIISS